MVVNLKRRFATYFTLVNNSVFYSGAEERYMSVVFPLQRRGHSRDDSHNSWGIRYDIYFNKNICSIYPMLDGHRPLKFEVSKIPFEDDVVLMEFVNTFLSLVVEQTEQALSLLDSENKYRNIDLDIFKSYIDGITNGFEFLDKDGELSSEGTRVGVLNSVLSFIESRDCGYTIEESEGDQMFLVATIPPFDARFFHFDGRVTEPERRKAYPGEE